MSNKYSAIRDVILSKLQTHAIIPIDFNPKEGEPPDLFDMMVDLNLLDTFYTHILPFADKLKLNELMDRLFNSSDKRAVSWNINGDLAAISWLISRGIVDSEGLFIFDDQSALLFCSKYEVMVYHLCWAVLKANDYGPSAKQETVGNSEGTSSSSTSSEQLNV